LFTRQYLFRLASAGNVGYAFATTRGHRTCISVKKPPNLLPSSIIKSYLNLGWSLGEGQLILDKASGAQRGSKEV
jgi:hypothetical protein